MEGIETYREAKHGMVRSAIRSSGACLVRVLVSIVPIGGSGLDREGDLPSWRE